MNESLPMSRRSCELGSTQPEPDGPPARQSVPHGAPAVSEGGRPGADALMTRPFLRSSDDCQIPRWDAHSPRRVAGRVPPRHGPSVPSSMEGVPMPPNQRTDLLLEASREAARRLQALTPHTPEWIEAQRDLVRRRAHYWDE